jgi:K+-transporting ATPase c subunit
MKKNKKTPLLSLFSLMVLPAIFYPLFVFALGSFEIEDTAEDLNKKTISSSWEGPLSP